MKISYLGVFLFIASLMCVGIGSYMFGIVTGRVAELKVCTDILRPLLPPVKFDPMRWEL